jgi:hypothetical protein
MQTDGLRALMRAHRERTADHAELFTKLLPQAVRAQDALVHDPRPPSAGLAAEVRSSHVAGPDDAAAQFAIDRFARRLARAREAAEPTRTAAGSRFALANALQPVRDLVIEGHLVLPQDRLLDIVGAPWPQVWTSRTGNTAPALQTVWANAADGNFGFSHEVHGSVDGVSAHSGAGFFFPFAPRIAPGIAQIRPYLPFLYQWASMSFRSREDNQGGFGVRVWSWDAAGHDMTLEQDFRIDVWRHHMVAHMFGEANSPSWTADENVPGPEWDDDYAFRPDRAAPYFPTRAGRLYTAAVWCTGAAWSVSPENRPGQAIGRIQAQMPLVVIGYQ